MKTVIAVLFAMLSLGAGPVIALPQKAPDTTAIAASLVAHPPTDLDAYYRLRQTVGTSGLLDIEREVNRLAYKEAGVMSTYAGPACHLPVWLFELHAGLTLARTVADDEQWRQVHTEIDSALAQEEAIAKDARAGKDLGPLLAVATGPYRRALKETDPRRKELARRVGDDQFSRAINIYQEQTQSFTPLAMRYLATKAMAGNCRTDVDNIAWLKSDLKANGWPTISQFGTWPDKDAWILVQHADQDRAFQHEVLIILEKLLVTKDTSASNYAYLYDRIAVNEGRPQRYGTQGGCTGPGNWEPAEVEDPDNLDKRRAAVGLPPEAEYKKSIARNCTQPPAK